MERGFFKNLKTKNSSGTLTNKEINKLLYKNELVITPLLEKNQIGEVSVDLRVGTDFLTQHQGRDAFIDTTEDNIDKRAIKSHYTETRRRLGETFLLHPLQPALFSTLEYIKLPTNVYAVLSLRSSYSRLGLTISTIVQPGYCGCISVEILNSGNTPIKIMAGARFIQARFVKLNHPTDYFNYTRKYTCQVRPVSSKANEDEELLLLKKLNNLP